MKQKRISLILGIIFCLLGAALIAVGIMQLVLASLSWGIALVVIGILLFLLSPVLLLISGLIDRDCAREYDRRRTK